MFLADMPLPESHFSVPPFFLFVSAITPPFCLLFVDETSLVQVTQGAEVAPSSDRSPNKFTWLLHAIFAEMYGDFMIPTSFA